jgi:tetrahydromethanopterin S-methyltransferase subunit H
MTTAVYDKARESFLKGEIVMQTDNIKAVLVDAGAYTVDLAAHQFLSDIAAGARIATSGNLGTKTTTTGIFDAADVTFTAVTGASVEAIVLYQDTGSAATSRLICYIDAATGLPVTPNGGNINVAWDNGTNKIFKL